MRFKFVLCRQIIMAHNAIMISDVPHSSRPNGFSVVLKWPTRNAVVARRLESEMNRQMLRVIIKTARASSELLKSMARTTPRLVATPFPPLYYK